MGNDGALPGNYLAGGAAGRSHGHVIIKTSSILHPTASARFQIVRCEDSCPAPKPSASPPIWNQKPLEWEVLTLPLLGSPFSAALAECSVRFLDAAAPSPSAMEQQELGGEPVR